MLWWKLRGLNKKGNCWDLSQHKYWGNSISVWDWDNKIIDGFNKDIQKGDMIIIPMQSGKQAVGIVTSIKFENDPDDMFFGKFRVVDYLDSLLCNKKFAKIYDYMKQPTSRYQKQQDVFYMRKDFYSKEREFI